MKREQHTSKFNSTYIKQSCTSNNTMQRKKYPELREHTATLILFYCFPRQAPSHKHSHKNPNEKRKKESRDFPLARRPTVRLPCASRATCAPRVSRLPCLTPLEHVRFSSHVRSSCLAPPVPRTSRATCVPHTRLLRTHPRLSTRAGFSASSLSSTTSVTCVSPSFHSTPSPHSL